VSDTCDRCGKPRPACICAHIEPIAAEREVLILQHPQEPGEDVGSARTAHLALPRSTLRTGLSWRNLKAALGRDEADPRRWAVLFLGGAQKYRSLLEEIGAEDRPAGDEDAEDGMVLLDRDEEPVADAEEIVDALEGLVVLDGTWSQAKALWWRNPWLLKLHRVVLIPAARSLYGRVRREPRRECLSTLESVAVALDCMGEAPEVRERLMALFRKQVELMAEQGLKPKRRGKGRGRKGGGSRRRR
jgi:DTW domain-containing protein YfiP